MQPGLQPGLQLELDSACFVVSPLECSNFVVANELVRHITSLRFRAAKLNT